jgi:Glycine-rich domain
MRLELAGSLIHPDPLVIKFNVDGPGIPHLDFDTQKYIDLGYTHFDVICIGGGGGMGGGVDSGNAGTLIRSYGGAGGGGGFHRVRGLLSALPSLCPIVVGAGGALGTESSNPANTTDGGDGGASTFNGATCRASGGKGGKRAQTNDFITRTQADGGEGGLGNRTAAGGGAAGGLSGTPSATGPGTPGTPGTDGTYNTIIHNIGQGGGGGAGGVGKYGGVTCNAATSGGRGSYNPGDTSVYGPADAPGNDTSSGAQNIIPGGASGAKAAPLNKLPYIYGQSKGERLAGDPGAIIVRVTAE